MESRPPTCPPLPIELWTQILTKPIRTAQLSNTWYTFRATSHLLRAAIEDAFRTAQLPHTRVHMCRRAPITYRHPGKHMYIDFNFARLDPTDRNLAIFIARPNSSMTYFPSSMDFLIGIEGMPKRGSRPERWLHEFQLRRLANATSLRCLRPEPTPSGAKEVAISFDWVHAYNDLLGEDLLAARLRNRWARENMYLAWEMGAPWSVVGPAKMVGDVVKDAFQRARTARIAVWCRRTGHDLRGCHDVSMEVILREFNRVEQLTRAFLDRVEREGYEEDDLYEWEKVASQDWSKKAEAILWRCREEMRKEHGEDSERRDEGKHGEYSERGDEGSQEL